MAIDSSLKHFLKVLKERETVISMVFGAVVVILVAILLVNSIRQKKSGNEVSLAEPTPEVIEETSLPSDTGVPQELSSNEIANTLPNDQETSTPAASQPSLLQKAGLFVLSLFKNKPTNDSSNAEEVTTPTAETGAPELVTDETGVVKVTNLPPSHTVIKGDSLWKIAEKYYGSGYNYVDIASANHYTTKTHLEIGQVLSLPDVKVRMPKATQVMAKKSTTTLTGTALTISGDSYTVIKGDNLWKIAVASFGDGYKWTAIYKANTDKIKSPGVIDIGWVLTIPRG